MKEKQRDRERDTHAGLSSSMRAVVDRGSNSRFFLRPRAFWVGEFPVLPTLASYSCENIQKHESQNAMKDTARNT